MARGQERQCVLNAANEIAVEAFLDGRIGYTDIARAVESRDSNRPIAPATLSRTREPRRRRNV